MCPDFRRGAEAIEKAQEKAKAGGDYRPFAPSIFWQNDEDERYLLFLNPIDDIPTVDMIGFIPIKKKKGNGDTYTLYEQVLARTDPSIDESVDPMQRDWDAKPRDTSIAVAVELEPLFETVKGRKRPRGFEVKTTEYERRVRDDEGNLTDETEEVISPVIGFITQSPHNFFNLVASFDAKRSPIEETPLSITRVGSGSSTAYTIDGFPEQELDLSNLIEYIDGVSYLDDDLDDLLEQLDTDDGDAEQASVIGTVMLDKRLEELADEDRYNELYEQITESLDRWGGNKNKKSAAPSEKKQRPSQRKKKEEAPEPEEDQPKEKPKKRTPRKSKNTKEEDQSSKQEDQPSKQDDPETMSKMDDLRKRAAARSAAKEKGTE
jgi:hypothetical protein